MPAGTLGETIADVGVIGGSGFYEMPGLLDARPVRLTTPYGEPSSPIMAGTLAGLRVAFLARHGEGHRLLPEEVPSRANIYALKALGVRHVIAVSAVGSLRVQIEPLHAVIPGQLIDRTTGRPGSFFGEGAVAHVGLADPFCPLLSRLLGDHAEALDLRTHRDATLVVINGPAFSTRAESRLYREWGADVIGMTAQPEARLAREAELHYGSLCFATDYDVWHEQDADVDASVVIENLGRSVAHARRIAADVVRALGAASAASEGGCGCADALGPALVTAPAHVPEATRRRLGVIVERYWGRIEDAGP